MLKVRQVTPMLLTEDMEASVRFYEGLGFETGFRDPEQDYAYLSCEGGALRLLRAGPNMDLESENAQHIVYFDVEDVDRLFALLKPFLDTLSPARVRAPFDQDYGQREFHVIEGPHLLMFGQSITG
ncbi:MAG: VOC family protein [Dinoroseobacter sp.]|nr:VOC family protein [Dinoroseobacter sp.]